MKKRPYHLCAAAIITSVIAIPVQSVMIVNDQKYDILTKKLKKSDEIQAFKQHISMLKKAPNTCFLHYMGATQNDIPRNKKLFDTYGLALCNPLTSACESKLNKDEAFSACNLPEGDITEYITKYKAAETVAKLIVTDWFNTYAKDETTGNFCRDAQCATLLYTLDPKEYDDKGSIRNFGKLSYTDACKVNGGDPIYTTLSVNRYFDCPP